MTATNHHKEKINATENQLELNLLSGVFVDAGNELMTAEDIYTALHHGKGIQNADVAVVSIDSGASILSGQSPIQNISNYHSFQFFPDQMLMWRYFQVGKGKIWKYTNVTCKSSVEIIKPFSKTSKLRRVILQ